MQANLFLKKWVLNCEGYIYCVKKSVKCSFILTKKTTTCKLIRWVDGAELSPLHQCSLCRRHVKTTWKLLCGEAVTPPKKKTKHTHFYFHTSSHYSCYFHFFLQFHRAAYIILLLLPRSSGGFSPWFLSSLLVQSVITESGMLALLYRPLKITHPSLPSTAGLTARSSQ